VRQAGTAASTSTICPICLTAPTGRSLQRLLYLLVPGQLDGRVLERALQEGHAPARPLRCPGSAAGLLHPHRPRLRLLILYLGIAGLGLGLGLGIVSLSPQL
jgi:hypothetical protein